VLNDGQDRLNHQITDKKRVGIKLTTEPTEDDKKEPGFNAGFESGKIEDLIEGLNIRSEVEKQERRRRRNRDDKNECSRREDRNRRKEEGIEEGRGELRG
jgi:hypothetical protein